MERAGNERVMFLDSACADDAEIRKDVETLISSLEKEGSFLKTAAMSAAPVISPGQTIGTYKVKSLLGAGGMGTVYRALDSRLKRDVALKVLPREYAGNAERISRFQREAELLA